MRKQNLLPPKKSFDLLSLRISEVEIKANPAMKIQNYTKIHLKNDSKVTNALN